ncbi:MAG TPA: SHOCT domain-containing protein [Gaiellaceae bacterium]|nr:SHOCT domain-containing protein [Gaiellaceae bacterium]
MSEVGLDPVATTPLPAVKAPAGRMGRRRRIAVWALVVAASVIAILSVLTTWVHRQVLDNHAWTKASATAIQDPTIRSAIATQVVTQLYDNVDVAAQLRQQLPPDFKRLAGPAAAALREPATQAVELLLAQERFQTLFVRASSAAQQQLVAVLENKTGHGISTGNGDVTLDIGVLLREVATQLGLPASVISNLPPDVGVITVAHSDQLNTAQKGVRAIKILSVWLLVLVLAMYVLAIYLAVGERRKTLAHIGWGLTIAGLVTLVARHFIGNYVVNTLSQPENRTPVRHLWLIETAILGQIGWAIVMYGLLTVLAALIAGPTPIATSLRREVAPVLNRRPELTWGATAVVWLLLILWGPTHALRTWWGILLLAVLLAAGVWVLRRQTLVEFPNAGLEHGTPSLVVRVTAGARKLTHRAPHAPAATVTSSTADELDRLLALRDKGALTQDEFEQAKKLALASP